MRVALDTNVLVYAEGHDDAEKAARAVAVIGAVYLAHEMVLPAQVLAEFTGVLFRKFKLPASAAQAIILQWRGDCEVSPTASSTIGFALDLIATHGLQPFDAIILAAAAEADCRVLLTEDMHEGFTWGGVTVVNPFAEVPHPLLAQMLADPGSPAQPAE